MILTIFELLGRNESIELDLEYFDLVKENDKLKKIIKDYIGEDTFFRQSPKCPELCNMVTSGDNGVKKIFVCGWSENSLL